MATKKDAAVSAANQLINLMGALKGLRPQIDGFVTAYNSEGYATTWGAMATAASGSDGALGSADGTPTAANPIDNRVASQAGLAKAVSKNQLVNAVVLLMQLQNFLGNVAVLQGNYNQSVDDLAS